MCDGVESDHSIGQFYMIQRYFDPLWRLKRTLSVGYEGKLKTQMAILNRYAYQFVKNRRRDIEVLQCPMHCVCVCVRLTLVLVGM
jgi:hypothetical protein